MSRYHQLLLLIIPTFWLGYLINSYSETRNFTSANSSARQNQQTEYYLPLVQGNSSYSGRSSQRINVPYFMDQIQFDETAIFWFGEVNLTENYSDARVGYTSDELFIHVAIFDRSLWYDETIPVESLESWDAVSLYLDINGNIANDLSINTYRFVSQLSSRVDRMDYQSAYQGNGAGWEKTNIPFSTEVGYRGSPNDSDRDSGWRLTYRIPFSSFGLEAPPSEGKLWGLGLIVHDRDDAISTPIERQEWPSGIDGKRSATWGEMSFGLSAQLNPRIQSETSTTIRHGLNGAVVEDGEVGGHTNCGKNLDRFSEWGNENYAHVDRINIQNQFDVADYPCYSKFFITFPLDGIPLGKSIISATLTLYQFGNAGGDEWGEAPASLIQVFLVEDEWLENSLTWNSAPQSIENVSRSWVPWIPEYPGAKGIPRTWEVTEAVLEAYSTGEPLKMALYSADSARHSGKYFWSSDYDIEGSRPSLKVTWADN
jgi:hypothetical protein